jgi:integrase
VIVQKYLRPSAIKAGVIKEDERVRFCFHNFRHSLASSVVKLKCDPKMVQGILRPEDVRTTMQLYAQSDQESRLDPQGKFLALLLGDKAHLLRETIQ